MHLPLRPTTCDARAEGACSSTTSPCAQPRDAVKRGHLSCIKRLYNPNTTLPEALLTEAARLGHLEVLQWICGCHRSDWNFYRTVCHSAAAAGQLHVLGWAYSVKPDQSWDMRCVRLALAHNQLEVLLWADRTLPDDSAPLWRQHHAYFGAISAGNLAQVIWLHHHFWPFAAGLCTAAASAGQLQILKYLRRHGCPWSEFTCNEAAHHGHLALLQWARAHGCPWGSVTAAFAAHGKHLSVLKWLRRTRCPWDWTAVCESAGSPQVLLWAIEHGAPVVFKPPRLEIQVWDGMLELAEERLWSLRQCFAMAGAVCNGMRQDLHPSVYVMAKVPREVVALIESKLSFTTVLANIGAMSRAAEMHMDLKRGKKGKGICTFSAQVI